MAKVNPYTERWFLDRNYTYDDKTGTWTPPVIKKGFIGEKKGFNPTNKDAITVINGKILKPATLRHDGFMVTRIDESTHINLPNDSVLTIDGLIAGLNGSKGLMRSHWSNTKKQKEIFQSIIAGHLKDNKMRKHIGEVSIEYIGYKTRFMDWDNFCASFKHIGDSLVKMGIIVDDSPKIVTQFIPSQIKVPQIGQKVVVIIKDK